MKRSRRRQRSVTLTVKLSAELQDAIIAQYGDGDLEVLLLGLLGADLDAILHDYKASKE